jgi:hypothetical protein
MAWALPIGRSAVPLHYDFRPLPNYYDFKEVVNRAWSTDINSEDAILRLHVKMSRTAKALSMWRRKTVGSVKIRLTIIQITLTHLEKAQENR